MVENFKVLDDKIILYFNNKVVDYASLMKDLFNKKINKNIWEFSSLTNDQDTDLTLNSKVFYLPNFDNLFDWWRKSNNNIFNNGGREKAKLRCLLNENILPFIVHYIKKFDLDIQTIKQWSVCENPNNYNFHSDMSRNLESNNYTVVVFLNDDYSGGEFQFKNRVGNELIKVPNGGILIYPSNEEYLHRQLPVTSGIKYIAIAYF